MPKCTWVLPVVVLLHQVHVVQRDIVELGVVDDRGAAQVVGSVHQGQDLDGRRNPPSEKYFCLNHSPIGMTIQFSKNGHNKSIDGLLGIRTRGGRLVDVDESTELWWRPDRIFYVRAIT